MKNEIKIEKGIAVKQFNTGKHTHWPFRNMKIGDSFLVPKEEESEKTGNPHPIRAAAAYFAFRNPEFKFTIRKTEEGLRCWRIAANNSV